MQPKEFTLPFLEKTQLTADTYEFCFDRTQADITFLPGQYIRMNLPHDNADERGVTRLFSITTSTMNTKELCITTRVIQSSFKKSLLALTSGKPITFFGPFGRFTLDEADTRPRIFLAGGIGITPFLSMLRTIRDKNLPLAATVFVSLKTPEEMIFKDEMEQLTKDLQTVKVVYTITRPEASHTTWLGETGRLNQTIIAKHVPDWKSALFYMSGPPAMVDAMDEMVQEMGLPLEQLRKEKFTGY